MEKYTVNSFKNSKLSGDKITVLTAYDYTNAKLLDESGVNCILVGDSLGMVMLGYEDTLKVTVEDMIHHTKAVKRGVKQAFIVTDMPFLSYHISVEESIRNAGKIIRESGANGVKLEGGREIADKIRGIIAAGIPVMGHLGLTPQSVNAMGGFKVQAKNEESVKRIIDDALILQESGAFALVLECIPEKVAKMITEKLDIPTIGIGAGKHCDGQVLVIQDMLGMNKKTPKFVKKYAHLDEEIIKAVKAYCREVKQGDFPEDNHTFSIDDEVLSKLY